jgi:small subunit ribosomal protein S4
LATTRPQARQLVNHGHVTVDGKRVDIPSYEVTPGQVISLRERSQNLTIVNEAIESTISRPAYVTFDDNKKEGSFVRLPQRDELEPEIDEALVVEYYNQVL